MPRPLRFWAQFFFGAEAGIFLGLQTLLLVSGRMPSKLPVIMAFVTKIAC